MDDWQTVSDEVYCRACGTPLGAHTVRTLVFSDDTSDTVKRVLSGEINHIRCGRCGEDAGWLWPPAFVYIDVPEQRAVCVTLTKASQQWHGLLGRVLHTDSVRGRGLRADVLTKRTQFVHDYTRIADALALPVTQLRQHSEAVRDAIGRSSLRGAARIERLLEDVTRTGMVNLEEDEASPAFLAEMTSYRDSGNRAQHTQGLDALIQFVTNGLMQTHRLLSRDVTTTVADLLLSELEPEVLAMARRVFDGDLERGVTATLRARLARLGLLADRGELDGRYASPLDGSFEMAAFIAKTRLEIDPKRHSASSREGQAMARAITFIDESSRIRHRDGLKEEPPRIHGSLPRWVLTGAELVRQIKQRAVTGDLSDGTYGELHRDPAVGAYVYAELAEQQRLQRNFSVAMSHCRRALHLLDTISDAGSGPSDPYLIRLRAVSLERLGACPTRRRPK